MSYKTWNSEIYNIPTNLSADALKLIRIERKEGKMARRSWKWNKNAEKTENEGNEDEFPPSEVNPCVFSTF